MSNLYFLKFRILLPYSLIVFVSCNTTPRTNTTFQLKKSNQIKIGFGSCLKQDKSMPIFESIKEDNFDLFLMIGDNVYGDSETRNLKELKLAYKKQKDNFEMMELDFPFEAIWDDHDYGMNDAGKDYPYKEISKELFLNFWNIPLDDIRRSREGLYFDLTYEIDYKTLQILILDTRTFRDTLMPSDDIGAPGKERYIPNNDSSLTILGENQWNWLRKKIIKPVDFRIIVSSIQFLSIGHGWESWNNFPHERIRLIDLIDNANLDHTLVISGDRHRGGIYQLKIGNGRIISEMTSSSLNASFPNKEEYGPLRIGSTYLEENYGAILIHSIDNSMSVSLKNINGNIVKSLTVEN